MTSPVNRHIFLTGLPGVGKTTLIMRLCDDLAKSNRSLNGFYTSEIKSNGVRIGFCAKSLNGKECTLASLGENNIKPRKMVGKYTVHINEFDSFTKEHLILKDNCIIVIDEIGKMELLSSNFVKSIDEIICEGRVLGTLPSPNPNEHPTISKIRNSLNVKLFQITKENRNRIYSDIFSCALLTFSL